MSKRVVSLLSEVPIKHTACLLLALVSLMASAQDRGFRSEGREFYLGYLHPTVGPTVQNINTSYEFQFRVYALVSSYEENDVFVSYFNASGKEEQPSVYKIGAGKTSYIQMDRHRMRHDSVGDKAGFLSCHIYAKRPISVQYFSTGPNSCGSYLALPVHAWGRKYVIASYNDNPGFGRNPYPSDLVDLTSGIFTIVAAYDGTSVTITPTAQTSGGHVGVNQGPGANGTPKPYTISLSRGQSYFVRSASSQHLNSDDISASIVTANKPVAVISGHENAFVGDGGAENCVTELRDFMIEQMIPHEYWDNSGVIGIPYRDSPGLLTMGIGENYRVYVADTDKPTSVLANEQAVFPMTYTANVELFNRTTPLSFTSVDDSSKFMVVQYDLRSHGVTSAPFPAPSMNTLISMSQWRNSYAWSFPIIGDKYHGCYKHYVNIICNIEQFDSIMVSVDNNPPRPIGTALKIVDKVWTGQIPGYPNLKAATYSISPSVAFGSGGTYKATAPFPFMAYHFGNRVSTLYTLFCLCPPEHHIVNYPYSYASPGGVSLFNMSVAANLSISIDTLCTGGWRICATDSNDNGGIRYVSLLDDSSGHLYPRQSYKHSNVSILMPNDPLRLGEFSLPGTEKSYCFTIGINDPGKDANAPVIIYDRAGNYRIVELRKSPEQLTISPDPFTNPDLFKGSKLGVQVCTTFTLHNDASNATPYMIESAVLSGDKFTLPDLAAKLPTTIQPGDSLSFDVCFESTDTLQHQTTLMLSGECLDIRIPFSASTVRPVLIASDVSFGDVLVGKTACKPVTLKNTGQASFTVHGVAIIQSDPIFSFDSTSSARFPLTVAPGATVSLTVCYTPDTIRSHTAFINWQTDITPPFAFEHKAITNLSGQGYAESGAVGEHLVANKIRIRPNPARDKIRIEFASAPEGSVSVSVYDVLGREVAQTTFTGLITDMELSLLADGIYYVRIVTCGQVITHPVEIRK